MPDPIGETVVVDETRLGTFQVVVRSPVASILADEPIAAGGLATGLNPFELLSSALGSCTVMTMRLYAERKQWPLRHARVKVTHHKTSEGRDRFVREINLEGDLSDEQRARILAIANKCPVHKTLEQASEIHTELVAQPVASAQTPSCDHARAVDALCNTD